MADAVRFKIENGIIAFTPVDTAAVGYLDTWQAPGGKQIDIVTLADYTDADAQWSCQVQTGTIDPTANNNDETTDPTWCAPAKTTPNPGETSWAINGTYLQDAIDEAGLWQYTYLQDTKESYFMMGLAGAHEPPMAVGRCRVIGSTFGGAGRVALTSTLGPLPVTRRFDAWVGAPGTDGIVILGATLTTRPGAPTVTAAATSVDDEAAAPVDDEAAA